MTIALSAVLADPAVRDAFKDAAWLIERGRRINAETLIRCAAAGVVQRLQRPQGLTLGDEARLRCAAGASEATVSAWHEERRQILWAELRELIEQTVAAFNAPVAEAAE